VSLPFTDECGLLTRGSVEDPAGVAKILHLGRQRSWKYAEFRGVQSGMIDGPPWLSFLGHTLDLSATKKRIWAGFAPSVRQAIRKAERSGVGVEISSSLGAVRDFYRLHCQTRKRHRLPPQPFAFFRRVQKQILEAGQGCVVLARERERPVAGGVFFYLGEKAVYKFGASDDRRQEVRGNNLMFWEAIRWLCDGGIRSLHFGRCSLVQEGLRRFKLGFGTTEHRIEYHRFDFRRGQYRQGTDPAFGWHNGPFGLLPMPLLRVAGALVYRHLNLLPLSLLLTILN
jgi:lipid II:glycine glycyltransferase (peptidoglycan interpeptide bridge formation enzyme)